MDIILVDEKVEDMQEFIKLYLYIKMLNTAYMCLHNNNVIYQISLRINFL